MKKDTGFTLIELMIALAIVGILLSVGMAPIKVFLQGSQLVASTNELLSGVHVARSEAIKLNSRVSICPTNGGVRCSGSDWSKGWVVFIDTDGNMQGTDEPCENATTDCQLRIHAGFTDNQLTVAGVDQNGVAISGFTFTSRGLPKTATGASRSGIFSVCSFDDSNNIVGSRAVVLALSGRVRVSDNSEVISCPEAP